MTAIDFTKLQRKNKMYAGANGSKISVVYEGKQYMLKFPPHSVKNRDMSYSNSCFSEYLGCQIYECIGFEFISSLQNEDCNRALRRILPRIDMARISAIIENMPFISDLQRKFYVKMLEKRKEKILDFSLALLEKAENHPNNE